MPSYTASKLIDTRSQSRREVLASKFGTSGEEHPKIAELRTIVPFDQYAFSGLDLPGLGIGKGVMLGSDMPDGFLSEFLAKGLYPFDPMSWMVSPEAIWGSWHDLEAAQLMGPQIQQIKALEMAFGISTRSVIGFFRGDFRFGGASFTRNTPFSSQEKFILENTARVIHGELASHFIKRMNIHIGLSVGEVACLEAVAKGLSAEAAAEAVNFTVETVNTYIRTACKKLGATNRTHVVAEALRRKIIE